MNLEIDKNKRFVQKPTQTIYNIGLEKRNTCTDFKRKPKKNKNITFVLKKKCFAEENPDDASPTLQSKNSFGSEIR